MEETNTTAVAAAQATALAPVEEEAKGFEESNNSDIIIPRIKVINALSPERIDGIAAEGDVLNSLTQENVKDKVFIPIKQYYSNIRWNPERNADTRIFCKSANGITGNEYCEDGSTKCISCAACKKNQFDNTKKGKEAAPVCTQYMNFLGFFEGSPMPVVLSFSKTNYNEGRKLLSIARSMRTSIWGYGYKIGSKKISKDRNTWYILTADMAGATTTENKTLAATLFNLYADTEAIKADYEESGSFEDKTATSAQTEAEI